MYEKDGIKYYSPDESFGYPKEDTSNIPYAKQARFDYICPHCGNVIPIGFVATEEDYEDHRELYPKYCNESLGGTPDGSYHDWEEIHCCPTCHKEFIITNGCY